MCGDEGFLNILFLIYFKLNGKEYRLFYISRNTNPLFLFEK